jgi:hypothetical protein
VTEVEIPEGSGNWYKYEWNPVSKKMEYLGPVGNAPLLTEVQFRKALRKVRAGTYTPDEVLDNPDLIWNLPVPEEWEFIKVDIPERESEVRFRLHRPKQFEKIFTLTGEELVNRGYQRGLVWDLQNDRVKARVHQFLGDNISEARLVMKDMALWPDTNYIVGTNKKTGEREVQSVRRRVF